MQSFVECSNFHKHSLYIGIWNSNSSVHMCICTVTGYFTVVLSLPLSLVQLKVKGDLTTCYDGTEWREGGRDIITHTHPWHKKGGSVVNPMPQLLYPWEGSSTHCTRSWVGLRAVLESMEHLASTRVHTIQPTTSNCSDFARPTALCTTVTYIHTVIWHSSGDRSALLHCRALDTITQ